MFEDNDDDLEGGYIVRKGQDGRLFFISNKGGKHKVYFGTAEYTHLMNKSAKRKNGAYRKVGISLYREPRKSTAIPTQAQLHAREKLTRASKLYADHRNHGAPISRRDAYHLANRGEP